MARGGGANWGRACPTKKVTNSSFFQSIIDSELEQSLPEVRVLLNLESVRKAMRNDRGARSSRDPANSVDLMDNYEPGM